MSPPPDVPPRLRVEVLRDRVPVRELVLRAVERVAPAPDVFARVPLAALVVPAEAEPADRELPDLAVRALPVAVLAFDRDPLDERDEVVDEEPDESSSPPHLPLITRCAASATASAMMLPSLVALDIMLVAACEAVSAASRPASRILRRALGLALIAAAAAARPAASISLLIAALAILSIVSLRDDDPDDPDDPVPEDLFLADFAIVNSSLYGGKTLKGRNGSLMTLPRAVSHIM